MNEDSCRMCKCAKFKWRIEMAQCCDLPIFPWNDAIMRFDDLPCNDSKKWTMKSVWQWGKSRASPVKRPILRFVDRPLNDQSCNLPISREMAPSCDLTIFRAMTKKNEQWKALTMREERGSPENMRKKISNQSMSQLPWKCQTAAWAFCREIVKLQHGSSGVKSSMQHGPSVSAMKSWNAAICRLSVKRCYAVICRLPGWLKTIRPLPPSKKMETMSRRTCARNFQIKAWAWKCQTAAWAFCREIVKLQHGSSGVKSSNCSMGHLPWNHSMSQLQWKCQNVVRLDSVVWIWKIFSVMCSW